MKITPLDIRHKEFRRSMRGYSDEEVDVFLDEVADEFERVFQQNIEMGERLQVLEDQVRQFESLKDTLNKTLVSAQQQADETRANAHKEAELILRDAELKGRDALADSYREKQRVQQALVKLRHEEEDFRFKFRSLLEAHLNLLVEDESSEERRRFRGLVAGVEEELQTDDSAPRETVLAETALYSPVQVPQPNGGGRTNGGTTYSPAPGTKSEDPGEKLALTLEEFADVPPGEAAGYQPPNLPEGSGRDFEW